MRVGDNKASLREGVRRPDVGECASAAVRDPEARILAVPAFVQIGVGGVVVVVGVRSAAVAAKKAHIINERIGARLPEQRNGAGIDSTGEDADAADDVRSARRREDDRFGRTNTLIACGGIEQIDLRECGMEADEHRVWLERDRVGHAIVSAGKVKDAMRLNGLPQSSRVVGYAIAFEPKRLNVAPFAGWWKSADSGGSGAGIAVRASASSSMPIAPITPSPGTISPKLKFFTR